MPYQVSRTDTGQFVWTDPTTDTVVIDDDLAAGLEKLERSVTAAEAGMTPGTSGADSRGQAATAGSSVFSFRGGPRYTPILLGVVLPFAWLGVFYLALSNLLAERVLDQRAGEEMGEQIEELEREVQALRTEIAAAPRTAKTKPKSRKSKQNAAAPARDASAVRGLTASKAPAEGDPEGDPEADPEAAPEGDSDEQATAESDPR